MEESVDNRYNNSIVSANDFDIRIKDNFLNKNRFTELYNKIPYKMYEASTNYLSGIPHVWYAADIEPQVAEYVKERCEEMFNIKLNINLCNYTMLATVEPTVHCDYLKEKVSHQIIIYIKGNEDIHKGTGFYVKQGNQHQLNTHIGFKENRAIFWDSRAYHSPLNFAANDKSKRFSIIAQYKEVK